ncbi:MAG: hypothetical protein HQ485_17040 [Acidobacteria bacterium]|nr:hypothetical protein [Acidobacteriota bacterium]
MPDTYAQPPDPTKHRERVEEFRALRATIRERGSCRVVLAVAGLSIWALLHLAIQIWLPTPVTFLVALLVLAAAFEAVFALHVGVERIGRYLEAAYEATDKNAKNQVSDDPGPGWEHAAHAFGALSGDAAGRVDPLFGVLFVSATLLNVVPVVLMTLGTGGPGAGPLSELALYGGLHLAVIVRIARARRFAGRQRDQELDIFTKLTRRD